MKMLPRLRSWCLVFVPIIANCPSIGLAATPQERTAPQETSAKAATRPAADPYDVLILGGRVIDGTGNAWFHGDVALRGGRIARIALRVC